MRISIARIAAIATHYLRNRHLRLYFHIGVIYLSRADESGEVRLLAKVKLLPADPKEKNQYRCNLCQRHRGRQQSRGQH